MRNKCLTFWIFFIAIILTSSIALADKKPKVLLKLATIAPRGSFMTQVINEMDAQIRQQTNNEVGIKLYYGGVQGDEEDVLRKVRLGQLHGGSFTGHGLGMIVSEVRVSELPFVFQNYDETDYVRNHLKEYMTRRFDEKGYVVLGWNEIGFVYNFSKVPIHSLEVAQKQKWWMWEGDPISHAMFDAFGITPIPLSITDVMTSLSTKLINTASITPYGAVAFHWYDRFEYMSEYPVTNVQGATLVCKRVWNKVSPENQKKIIDLCQPYFDRLNVHSRIQDKKSIAVLRKSGIKIAPFDADGSTKTLDFIHSISKKARENLVGKLYSQELLDQTLSLLDDYRKLHPDSHVQRLIK
jgi:TRAP-type C4-dicarboxylate transport system substrate-binding protein